MSTNAAGFTLETGAPAPLEQNSAATNKILATKSTHVVDSASFFGGGART